ncbi:hypothetical protein [Vibrio phage vB_pir03]|nr:hypothetical protein [Vibrio phage vB_pir03]
METVGPSLDSRSLTRYDIVLHYGDSVGANS